MDTVSHGSVLVFWLPGLETARRLTRRKLFVVSVRSCHHTRGTRLTSPPILSTIIQRSILLSWRSLAKEPVPVPVVVVHLCKQHFRRLSLVHSPYQRLAAVASYLVIFLKQLAMDHGEVQTEEEVAEAELRRYESEPGETLDCQQPSSGGKLRSVNYKYLSKL